MKRVAITGATGFVGRRLCQVMLENGWQVRGVVRSAKGGTGLPAGVETVQVPSIGPESDWSGALNGVDAVVHLAARVHVMNEMAADPAAEFREVNVRGSERLARMAAQAGVRRFVFISSVKVNGEGGGIAYTEKDQPAPGDAYGTSKLEAEQALNKIAASTGLEVAILRPPVIYGPGVKANFLRMLEAVERGFPLPLANIRNRRSFIYIENMVHAIITCIEHPHAAGQTYLVSDGHDVSVPELIRRIAAALGRPARLFPFPASLLRLAGRLSGNSAALDRLIGSLTVDISKIERDLGWVPPCTMEQGIKETATWFKTLGGDRTGRE